MLNCSQKSVRAARCAVCDRKFGLLRRYSWRTPLCSKKCVDRFRTRRESDRIGAATRMTQPRKYAALL